MTTFKSSW